MIYAQKSDITFIVSWYLCTVLWIYAQINKFEYCFHDSILTPLCRQELKYANSIPLGYLEHDIKQHLRMQIEFCFSGESLVSPLLVPGPLWTRVVISVRAQSVGQVHLSEIMFKMFICLKWLWRCIFVLNIIRDQDYWTDFTRKTLNKSWHAIKPTNRPTKQYQCW